MVQEYKPKYVRYSEQDTSRMMEWLRRYYHNWGYDSAEREVMVIAKAVPDLKALCEALAGGGAKLAAYVAAAQPTYNSFQLIPSN